MHQPPKHQPPYLHSNQSQQLPRDSSIPLLRKIASTFLVGTDGMLGGQSQAGKGCTVAIPLRSRRHCANSKLVSPHLGAGPAARAKRTSMLARISRCRVARHSFDEPICGIWPRELARNVLLATILCDFRLPWLRLRHKGEVSILNAVWRVVGADSVAVLGV